MKTILADINAKPIESVCHFTPSFEQFAEDGADIISTRLGSPFEPTQDLMADFTVEEAT